MNIELIIFLVSWLVSTEVIFFGFIRGQENNFLVEKCFSVLTALLISTILFLFPFLFSVENGLIAYVWYYGAIGIIILFFLINYAIHKWLENIGK